MGGRERKSFRRGSSREKWKGGGGGGESLSERGEVEGKGQYKREREV